jgi:hypothetical protein
LAFACQFSGCTYLKKWFDKSDTLAEVYGNVLKKSEAEAKMPPFLNKRDSALFIKDYVNSWVANQLLLEETKNQESKWSNDQFENTLEKAEENLKINEFLKFTLKTELDTAVKEEELLSYYNQNKSKFLLEDKVIKGFFIKIEQTSPLLSKLRTEFAKNKDDIEELKKMAQSQAKDSVFSEKEWLELSKFLEKVPPLQNISVRNELIANRQKVVESKGFVYFVRLKEIAIESEPIPYELAKQSIKDAIIGIRKQEIITKLKEKIHTNASKSGDFKIYTN